MDKYVALLIQEIFDDYERQENEVFETCLRVVAEPPIKGKITKGKIQWRGIKLVIQKGSILESDIKWLEQRGKPISPKVSLEMPSLKI